LISKKDLDINQEKKFSIKVKLYIEAKVWRIKSEIQMPINQAEKT
jgi:hypothetical protein